VLFQPQQSRDDQEFNFLGPPYAVFKADGQIMAIHASTLSVTELRNEEERLLLT
jgi:hypothetical protein